MLPTLTKVLDLERMTNNSTRPTSIRYMKRGGNTDREIITVSGHRTTNSLPHYDPSVSNEVALGMAKSVANAGLPPKLGLMAPPKPRRNPNSQINYSEPSPRVNPFVEDIMDEFHNSQDDQSHAKKKKAMEYLAEVETEEENLDPDWLPGPFDVDNVSKNFGKIILRTGNEKKIFY